MLDELISIYNHTDYDFRNYAFPGDKLSHLFNEWVDYYRMKFAITKMIRPMSILEIGVRYGYSAITFLKASENATYLGIDNDSNTFGGNKGAGNWAKKITQNYKAEFLLANSQLMTTLPGDFYDLIHIDGQQDGDGTFHDLELALEKGKWLLVDGYFWSDENLLSATYFLNKYKDFIEFAITIPSYAGELLIKTKSSAKHMFVEGLNKENSNLEDIIDSYKRYKGREFEDSRLVSISCLANPNKDMNILDVGCGRGELSYTLSKSGAHVTGIDDSSSAIKTAKAKYLADSSMKNLEFIQDNFLNHKFNKKYDRIIATDLIERVPEDKLELVILKIAELLKEDGLFITYVYPNKLYYQYTYEEKRKIAKSIGFYIPENPRTFYEDLRHINEQTPQSLFLNLNKYFSHILTWVNDSQDLAGSLTNSFNSEEYNNARTILAVSSFEDLDRDWIVQLLSPRKLDRSGINVEALSKKDSINTFSNKKFKLHITLKNNGKERLVSLPPYPVNISYHWLKTDGTCEVFDGLRTGILPALNPNEQRDLQVDIVAPQEHGEYQLQIDLVQESCFWLQEITNKPLLNISAKVEQNPDECRSEESKMDTFEIKDDEINVEEIMEKIRENIRERKENEDPKNTEEIEHVFSEVSSKTRSPQESGVINSDYDLRNDNYTISSHRPFLGPFLIKGRKLVHGEIRRYVDPVLQKQSQLNYNLAGVLSDAKETADSCSNKVEKLKSEIEQLEDENRLLKSEVEQLSNETEKLKSEVVSSIKKEVESIVSAVNLDLENKAWLNRVLESRIQKGLGNQGTNTSGKSNAQINVSGKANVKNTPIGKANAKNTSSGNTNTQAAASRSVNAQINLSETADSQINYYVFEERFRGSRENIIEHQTNFIGYFENCTNVLDIGCGRGEFLELAKQKGINATGIDVDEDMINFCKSKGLNAELKDAIKALEEIKDKSLDGIFISQVVEHLNPRYLVNMLNLCNKKMKYGFYIIIETVNPLSLFSLANFYIDLSHIKPVHPETLKYLVSIAGFRDIETKFSSPVPPEMKLKKLPNLEDTDNDESMIEISNQNIDMINDALYGAQDYAVIGKK
ncbi:hypothetical protein MSBRW_0626 [Methanosarcina barkeri str. Wiesmoor]|uniref:Methyltransferase domain-containing protein n=2 Tax=Methanosarcina barkeri TaxID=2208 RepID=A0A0E3QK49_METBA|nr:methyltransferase domain-containing protein [Methanosarcina barkeri]AKB49879.1 hypothetical protein MSBRW_0626 [Methanosarcina barkeri str. Wiesmoor]